MRLASASIRVLNYLDPFNGVFKGPITLDDLALNSSNSVDLLFIGVLSLLIDSGIFFSTFIG